MDHKTALVFWCKCLICKFLLSCFVFRESTRGEDAKMRVGGMKVSPDGLHVEFSPPRLLAILATATPKFAIQKPSLNSENSYE